ncbi:MAG: Threonine synthase [Streblomastix strix]|uniref:Threonine synthase n=1 Tax=Streblomastix strix TaxID=222440 RepID=A0A5J4W256_9EUKA|nr:MAG: Threonine synthase [Streblomastix strix]
MDEKMILGCSCSVCGQNYTHTQADTTFVCPKDGGNLNFIYNYAELRSSIQRSGFGKGGMWRYLPLLPIPKNSPIPPLIAGDTPLQHISVSATHQLFGQDGAVIDLFIKDEGKNPTGSLKDRASALVVSKALSEKKEIITTASTGNAAAALSGMCASVNLPCIIFVPSSAPPAKIAQLQTFGARVFLVKGDYDQAFDLCMECSNKFGWYNRSTGYNPYTSEGKKTVSYEICEQLASYIIARTQPGSINACPIFSEPSHSSQITVHQLAGANFASPDWIVVSVGDGNIISGVWSGLKDLFALGIISALPHILAVQAEGSNYIKQALDNDGGPLEWHKHPPIHSSTVADSISADQPKDRVRACIAIRDSGGSCITVSDEEILNEIPNLGKATGIFAEPAASCAVAGLRKALHQRIITSIKEEEPSTVALIITGSGLKDIASAQRAINSNKDLINSSTFTVDISVEQVESFIINQKH